MPSAYIYIYNIMANDKGCLNCGNDELCNEISTECVYYKGDGCESQEISNGDSLTSVIDKLINCDTDVSNTDNNGSTDAVEACEVYSQPECLQGINQTPINYSLDKDLLLSYDISGFLNSLGSDFALIRSKVSGYSDTSIFTSNNLQGGYSIPFESFPISLDVDVVVNSKCGRIQFKKTIIVGCNSVGSFGVLPEVFGGGQVTLDSQDKYNKHLLSEIQRLTILVNNRNINLPTCDLLPTSDVTVSSGLIYTADAVCKLDSRLKELETVEPCFDECSTCPNSGTIGIVDAFKSLCAKIEEQQEVITSLTDRITNLESYH